MGGYLKVDHEATGELLLDDCNEPVWPAVGAQVAALQQTAALFATPIKSVRVKSVDDIVPRRRGDVVAVGEGFVVREGRLYAHLTGRAFRALDTIEEVIAAQPPEVLVIASKQLTHRLLDHLYDLRPNEPAPGIILLHGEGSARIRVLIHAAAAISSGAIAGRRRISIVPTADLDQLSIPGCVLIGGRASEGSVLSALSEGSGVLCVSTHSDGIDALLTPRRTLCPLDRIATDADDDRDPVCRRTAFCHRSGMPMARARHDGRLVSVDTIAARVLVWNVCNGVIPSSGRLGQIVDDAWGVVSRMLDSPRIGSVVTTWYQALSSPLQVESLPAAIASGAPLGDAVAEFNRSLYARQSGMRFCLLGDPQSILPVTAESSMQAVPAVAPPQHPSARGSRNRGGPEADANFLTSWLSLVSERNEVSAESAASAVSACRAFRQSFLGGESGNAPPAAGRAMREAVTRHLARFGSLATRTWLQLTDVPHLIFPARPCFGCGLQTNSYVAFATNDRFPPRRIGICPGCGIVEDVPVESTAIMQVDSRLDVQLSGIDKSDAWTCRVVAESKGSRNNQLSWDWPRQLNGQPAESFRLPGPFPPGPLRIMVIFMSEAKIFILSQPARPRAVALDAPHAEPS